MSAETFLDGRVVLHCGDCLDILPTLAENSIDAVCTDPPYGLEFMGKEWDKFGKEANHRSFERSGYGLPRFGAWTPSASESGISKVRRGNIGFQEFSEQWAREVYRVLKPGAHLLACGGTRTYHRMACAIEDAGFEVRDCIQWLYGSGFSKVGYIRDSNGDVVREGWAGSLKPACEIICLARKPLSEGTVAANVLRWGTGAMNIDACRVGVRERPKITDPKHNGHEHNCYGAPSGGGNLLPAARWPSNVIHDGSEEVLAGFPETGISGVAVQRNGGGQTFGNIVYSGSGGGIVRPDAGFADGGSAARFFYTAKADSDDRLGSKHPTVKPLDLKQYLVRMICPRGGLVLDLFAGTGTTGEAAWREGMRAILIEREAEYQGDIRRRMRLAMAGPDERTRESVKAKNLPRDDGPLFA